MTKNIFLNKSKNKSNGFTLVELVVYMGIVMIFMLVLTDILEAILNTRLSSQSTSEVAQDGRFIYTRLIYDINRSSGVILPLNIGDTSTSLQATISGSLNTYSLSSGNLILNDSTTSAQLNSVDTSVSNLTFTRIGNPGGKNTFQIKFTVTSKIPTKGAVDAEVFQTTAGPR